MFNGELESCMCGLRRLHAGTQILSGEDVEVPIAWTGVALDEARFHVFDLLDLVGDRDQAIRHPG
jgi:hypothetical protein